MFPEILQSIFSIIYETPSNIYTIMSHSPDKSTSYDPSKNPALKPFTYACIATAFIAMVYASDRIKKWIRSPSPEKEQKTPPPQTNTADAYVIRWWEVCLVFALFLIPISLMIGLARLARLNIETPGYVNKFLDDILSNNFVLILACMFIGLVAYYIRSHRRMLYSIIELAIGCYASVQATDIHDPLGGLQFAAGIYIIVRALDNIEKALSDSRYSGGVVAKYWSRVFQSK